MRAARPAAVIAAASWMVAATPAANGGGRRPADGIEEPSGVTRAGNALLVVGDGDARRWYECPVAPDARGLVPLVPATLAVHGLASARAATDLEAVDVLADGRVVVLSEDARSLFDARGRVVRYPEEWQETDGRGLEGLAVSPAGDGASRVAALWEGGYLRRQGGAGVTAARPRVLVHRVAAGAHGGDLREADVERRVELRVPEPDGREPYAQRFRAPDLVWHRWTDEAAGQEVEGWIVLLSSGWEERPEPGSVEECAAVTDDGRPRRWCHRWLQRFGLDGAPAGDPLDLDPLLPESVRWTNWEGLGWFEPGRALVLVYDESVAERSVDPQQAFVLELPPGW